jgi:hypothetical protein
MSKDESQAFVVRDRRSRGEDHGPTPTETPPSGTTESKEQTKPSPGPSRGSTPEQEPRPPVTFSSFIFSLGTSALMVMGEQIDPQQERIPVNLVQAKEIIDILSMLESKTQGNLTADEQSVLTDMLYALRMKYISLASGKPATTSP